MTTILGKALVAVHDWTFLFGPGLAIGVNTLMLAYLMYRSGLVPRLIAVLGLIGGPVVFASSTAALFGLYPQVSVWGSIAAIPVFAWEMSLAAWLIARDSSRRLAGRDQPVLGISTETLVALTVATASMPGSRPSSSAASRLSSDTTR